MNYLSLKNKLLAVLFFLLISSFSSAEIVKKIIIDGNERVNTETIKIFGKFKLGDDLNKNDLNKILKNLYETNFFENVNLSFNDSILSIKLVENQIIQNLVIKGVENETLKKKLTETISLKEKNPYVENEVKFSLNNIKNISQEIGYYFSKVEILQKENSNNTIDIILNVDLGKKAFINEIVFLGDKKFK